MLRRLVYAWYERRLEADVRRSALPQHIGILPDGNRRFARLAGMRSVAEGHRSGADTIWECGGGPHRERATHAVAHRPDLPVPVY